MRKSALLSGRGRQASLNDDLILDAARQVFLADPSAPVSAVAERAGVGMSALYRRYPSKNDLLQSLCREGLHRYIVEAQTALGEAGNPWDMFCAFMNRIVAANTHALSVRLAGTFAPTPDLYELANAGQKMTEAIFERVAGFWRPPRRRGRERPRSHLRTRRLDLPGRRAAQSRTASTLPGSAPRRAARKLKGTFARPRA